MFVGFIFICACVALLRFVCRRCLVIFVLRLTKRATGTPNPLRVFGARALIVSLFSGFVVFAGKANHQGWWRCLVALRLSQVYKGSCARSIPSDILYLT
jgi:hypothetical protein